ncbi:MAG: FHA domain-containing protein [Sulfurimonas sp.]|nr:FHA domain-containing protein [Sulfurimonas sp.]
MSTKDTPTASELYKLIVLQGPDRGKEFQLEPGREYVAGRADDCHIRMDASDKTVSRQHARLTTNAGNIRIENLSAANPVQVKGKPVQTSVLKHKGQFRIGETLFVFEQTGGRASSATAPNKKILVFVGLGLACLMLLLMIFSGGDEKSSQKEAGQKEIGAIPSDMQKASSGTQTTETIPGATVSDTPAPGTGVTVSPEDRKTADQHFRQGMFFYDTGNLSRAVDEWNRAVVLYPDHPDARVWFLRAEKELEEQVKTHYQNAMMHYKYMRYDDAAHEFRLVVELSRNKTGDQYVNALKTLNELEGR